MGRIDACDEIDDYAEGRDNFLSIDLGETKLSDLADASQSLLADLEPGQASTPFEMSAGWASIYVCKRQDGSESLPSRDQVENQLYGQELGLISERELRNARREATILIP